ncbi:hypothetical protein FA10DRAFT_301177 [Acaromyces ingoldii]|uniref:Uncharacterized protein n=1 Tax=Acaromyces ingoldii TaxID=215250 RepID=A0A316YP93_9BASI|nr:hypothetical protein FA10DRAFT_301177 [Acaromyces ingoldii]PWN89873.1 hypothetical protein FA10DRAFT_301177 [Acaromyces ingoldii]
MSSNRGFDTGEGTYDREAEARGEGLDVNEGPTGYHGLSTGGGSYDDEEGKKGHGEGFSTGEGEADRPGEDLNAGQDGHKKGGGVSLNAGGDDDDDPNANGTYDVGAHLSNFAHKIGDKIHHKQ